MVQREGIWFGTGSKSSSPWITPDLTWNTVVQYDNISKQVGLNSRIRWTWRPGDDLFFIVNQGWDYDDGRFTRPSSEIFLKAAATFRF